MSAASAAAINPKDLIEGLGKGLRVIEAFDDDHPRLTASEAAALAGITRTAARRHLLSLVHFGYAATDGKQFWLAPRVLRLGQSYLGAARLPRLVQPFIQRVSMQCGETVNVSVLDGHEVVYLARSKPAALGLDRLPGGRARAGACGHARRGRCWPPAATTRSMPGSRPTTSSPSPRTP